MFRRKIDENAALSRNSPSQNGNQQTPVDNSEADIVVLFAKNAPVAQVDAVCRILKSTAEISVRHHITNVGIQVLFISARWYSLLKWAELKEVPKRLLKEYGALLQPFHRQNATEFQDYHDKAHFFTKEERQSLTLALVENIRLSADMIQTSQILATQLKLAENQPLVPLCLSKGLIGQVMPLHDQDMLERLELSWVRSFFSPQPLDDICDYFGVQLSLYFAWLGHYTSTLLLPTVIGMVYWLATLYDTSSGSSDVWFVLFALFNIVWSTLYLESWKRRSAELAFRWGTLDLKDEFLEEPRPLFRGEMAISEVTGRLELQYPDWKRHVRRFCVGWPVILLCVVADAFVLWSLLELQFWWEHQTKTLGYGGWSNFVPKIILVLSMGLMENIYKKIAVRLNEFENYRFEEVYQNHLIVKLALFQFINSFGSLFYIAFYLRDMQRLRKQMAALLIVRQVIGNIKESLIPFIKGRIKHARMQQQPLIATVLASVRWKRQVLTKSSPPDDSTDNSVTYKSHSTLLSKAEKEAAMPQYEGTFEDYLEMFIQFGYVILFSSAFPLAAFCAWLNNIIEIRSDAFKMCSIFQKPFAQRAKDIGTWQDAMELMGVIGVLVNCALIGMSGMVQRWFPALSTGQTVLFTLALEHVILSLKMLLAYMIPDIPGRVQTELARAEFRRREALKGTSTSASPSTSPSNSAHTSPHRKPTVEITSSIVEVELQLKNMNRQRRIATATVSTQYLPPLSPNMRLNSTRQKTQHPKTLHNQIVHFSPDLSSSRKFTVRNRRFEKQISLDEKRKLEIGTPSETGEGKLNLSPKTWLKTTPDPDVSVGNLNNLTSSTTSAPSTTKDSVTPNAYEMTFPKPAVTQEIYSVRTPAVSGAGTDPSVDLASSVTSSIETAVAGAASVEQSPRTRSIRRTGSMRKTRTALRLLERTRSLSHILHRPFAVSGSGTYGNSRGSGGAVGAGGGGKSVNYNRNKEDGRVLLLSDNTSRILEENASEQSFGELSFLKPHQIISIDHRNLPNQQQQQQEIQSTKGKTETEET